MKEYLESLKIFEGTCYALSGYHGHKDDLVPIGLYHLLSLQP